MKLRYLGFTTWHFFWDGLCLFIQKYIAILLHVWTIYQHSSNRMTPTLVIPRCEFQDQRPPHFWRWLKFHSPSHWTPKKWMVNLVMTSSSQFPLAKTLFSSHKSHWLGHPLSRRGDEAPKPRHPKNEFTTSRLESNRGT